jgi:RNA polymerase sigma factor (TIGR02999 family)
MKAISKEQVTQLLQAWNLGDDAALEGIVPLVYDELRRLAHSYMRRERPDHLLQTTALINEAYLRFNEVKGLEWKDRNQFVAISACLMRRILVEFARSRDTRKRGGGQRQLTFNEELFSEGRSENYDLLALDQALTNLAEQDSRKAQVVELRFFGGLSVQETAESLKISQETVARDWRFAKAWLRNALSDSPESEASDK